MNQPLYDTLQVGDRVELRDEGLYEILAFPDGSPRHPRAWGRLVTRDESLELTVLSGEPRPLEPSECEPATPEPKEREMPHLSAEQVREAKVRILTKIYDDGPQQYSALVAELVTRTLSPRDLTGLLKELRTKGKLATDRQSSYWYMDGQIPPDRAAELLARQAKAAAEAAEQE